MSNEIETIHRLRRELKETQQRLTEAEDLIEAVRNGEVDGLVIVQENVPKIFTLRDAQEPYRLLIEKMSEGSVTMSENGLILFSNASFARLIRMPLEKVIGARFTDLIEPTDKNKLENLLSTAWKKSVTSELNVIVEGGETLPLRIGLSRLELNSMPVLCAIISDLSETKALEVQLLQAKKLESVGRLAGGIAHDFNNMLTAIIGYSEIILGSQTITGKIRSNLEEISKAAHRSADLTRQLLAFSRRQILKPEIADLNYLVADTLKILRRVIGENIKIVTSLNPNTGYVKVDPGQFSQIIMNLAVNARDAMPNGGRLKIKTDNVEFDAERGQHYTDIDPGRYISLSVSDTGCGMSDEIRTHIFDPFFTTKEVGQGTGLGLSTVYGIVKQSGGEIEVLSREGAGTCFIIYLPKVEKLTPANSTKEILTDELEGTETILLVEDEDMVRNLARSFLIEYGYTVLEARNGFEALRICQDQEGGIDLLITDIMMPQMGGYELAKQLRTKYPDLRVIYISGYSPDRFNNLNILAKNSSFIQKPFSLELLVKKIREILKQKGTLRDG